MGFIARQDERLTASTIRLGVTGLSRAGKTVFITSLISNLLDRASMTGLSAAMADRIVDVDVTALPDDEAPLFEFEKHLAALTGPEPHWPESTDHVSGRRVTFRVKRTGAISSWLDRERLLHLDLVDYPGEWLLDLELVSKETDYGAWSEMALARAESRSEADGYRELLMATDSRGKFDELLAGKLARAWTDYLKAAQKAGYSDATPGHFLHQADDKKGSPALTFAPLPKVDSPRGSLLREFARRYDAFKKGIVARFFKDHFAKIDRQIVLIDVLGALAAGPWGIENLRRAMEGILDAFHPYSNPFLKAIMRGVGGPRIDQIMFAATKVDHLHHTQHGQLVEIMRALTRDAKRKAVATTEETRALAIAALRTTAEVTKTHQGRERDLVTGKLLGTDKTVGFDLGELPHPQAIFDSARPEHESWLGEEWPIDFSPMRQPLKAGEGLRHINLDIAVQELLGDKLK